MYDPFEWVDDDGSYTLGTLFSAERMNHIEQGIAAAHPPVLLAPPADAIDGQKIVLYREIPPNNFPVMWTFRYRASDDRWYFIGGPSAYASSIGAVVINTAAGANLWNYDLADYKGPQFRAPWAGNYDIRFTADAHLSTTNELRISLSDNAAGAGGGSGGNFGHAMRVGHGTAAYNVHTGNGRGIRDLAANTLVYLAVMFLTNNAGNISLFQLNGQFDITPVYLNGV